MANEIFNISKGRHVEFHERVNNNDPSTAVLTGVLLTAAESDATLRDYDDLGTLLAAVGNTECTFDNYARRELTDSDIAPATVDDTNDRYDTDITDWSITAAGGTTDQNIVKMLHCYDSVSGSGTDSNIVPISHHDVTLPGSTTNGTDLLLTIAAAGVTRAA